MAAPVTWPKAVGDGQHVYIWPRLKITLPEPPEAIVHGSDILVFTYPGDSSLGMQEIPVAELLGSDSTPDNTMLDIVGHAFEMTGAELDSHYPEPNMQSLAHAAAHYKAVFEFEFLTRLERDAVTVYWGQSEEKTLVGIVFNRNQPDTILQIDAKGIRSSAFEAMLGSIEAR